MSQNVADCIGLLPLNGEVDMVPIRPLTADELYPAGQFSTGRLSANCAGDAFHDADGIYLPPAPPTHFGRIVAMWSFLGLAFVTFACTGCMKCGLFVSIIPLLIAGDLVGRDSNADRYNGYAFFAVIAIIWWRAFGFYTT